jgi:hypothetical protein
VAVPLISALRKQNQEDCEFDASLGYTKRYRQTVSKNRKKEKEGRKEGRKEGK